VREAKTRRDLIGGEIAAGRNPAELLQSFSAEESKALAIRTWADEFIDSRIDVDANTIKNYRTALKKVCATFGDRDPKTVTSATHSPSAKGDDLDLERLQRVMLAGSAPVAHARGEQMRSVHS
jgi:hypothetical protein